MKCRDVERLILNFSKEVLDEDAVEKAKQHMAVCPGCMTLEEDLEKIKISLQQTPFQTASEQFLEQTRAQCHAILARPLRAKRKDLSPSIPKWIWAAFSTLLLLTSVLMLPLASGIDLDQPLTFAKVGVIILALQNLVMLFFAPVLFQRIRFPKKKVKSDFMPSEPREA